MPIRARPLDSMTWLLTPTWQVLIANDVLLKPVMKFSEIPADLLVLRGRVFSVIVIGLPIGKAATLNGTLPTKPAEAVAKNRRRSEGVWKLPRSDLCNVKLLAKLQCSVIPLARPSLKLEQLLVWTVVEFSSRLARPVLKLTQVLTVWWSLLILPDGWKFGNIRVFDVAGRLPRSMLLPCYELGLLVKTEQFLCWVLRLVVTPSGEVSLLMLIEWMLEKPKIYRLQLHLLVLKMAPSDGLTEWPSAPRTAKVTPPWF